MIICNELVPLNIENGKNTTFFLKTIFKKIYLTEKTNI